MTEQQYPRRNIVFDDEDSRGPSPSPDGRSHQGGDHLSNPKGGHSGRPTQANSVNNDWRNDQKSPGFGSTSQKSGYGVTQSALAKSSLLAQFEHKGIPDGQIIDCNQLAHPLLSYQDGVYYGMLQGKQPNGYGMFWYNNGDVYVGLWKNGIPNQQGYYYLAEGGFYFGGIDRGYASGYGIYYNKTDEFYYQGTFEAGFLEGKGYLNHQGIPQDCNVQGSKVVYSRRRPVQTQRKIELPKKIQSFEEELTYVALHTNPETKDQTKSLESVWEGLYIGERNSSGQRHGVGTVLSSNGSRFHGMFCQDRICGLGAAVDNSNNIRLGMFGQGGLHLYGSCATGQDLYVGGFTNGVFAGPAIYYDHELDKYVIGTFDNGELACKTYGGDGKISSDHLNLGYDIVTLLLQKAFSGFYRVNESMGCSVLVGRDPAATGGLRPSVEVSMENKYFRKMIASFLQGSEHNKARRFNGRDWERRNKSPTPDTRDMYKQVLTSYFATDIKQTPDFGNQAQSNSSKPKDPFTGWSDGGTNGNNAAVYESKISPFDAKPLAKSKPAESDENFSFREGNQSFHESIASPKNGTNIVGQPSPSSGPSNFSRQNTNGGISQQTPTYSKPQGVTEQYLGQPKSPYSQPTSQPAGQITGYNGGYQPSNTSNVSGVSNSAGQSSVRVPPGQSGASSPPFQQPAQQTWDAKQYDSKSTTIKQPNFAFLDGL